MSVNSRIFHLFSCSFFSIVKCRGNQKFRGEEKHCDIDRFLYWTIKLRLFPVNQLLKTELIMDEILNEVQDRAKKDCETDSRSDFIIDPAK